MNQTAQANGCEYQFALRRVGEVCELLNGLAFKPEEWSAAGIPIIRIQNLNGGQEFNFYEGFISEDYIIKPSTLLFAWSGNRGTSFGPFVWQGPTGVLNQHIFKVTPKTSIDANWLHHALQIARERAEREAHGGSGLVHVRRKDLLSFRIPTPDANEQSRIAAVLDTVGQAIAKTEAVIAKLKQVRAGLLHDLLTHGLDENGHLRDPIAHPEQFQDSPLGRIPREWEIRTLNEIVASAVDGPFGSNLKTEHYVNEPGVRVVRLQNIESDRFDESDKAFVSEDHALSLQRHQVVSGDLLVASMGDENHPLARACLYPDHLPPGIVKADCFRLRMKPTIATNGFVMLFLNCPSTRRDLNVLGQGVTRDRVNLTTLLTLRVLRPPVEEQRHIVRMIDTLNLRIQTEDALRSKLVFLKSGLMADLLTGLVRVPEGIAVAP